MKKICRIVYYVCANDVWWNAIYPEEQDLVGLVVEVVEFVSLSVSSSVFWLMPFHSSLIFTVIYFMYV